MEFAQGAIDALICIVRYGVGLIRFTLYEIINEWLAWASVLLSAFALVVPGLDIPIPSLPDKWAGYINWLLPMDLIITLYGYVIPAFAVYRLIKYFSSRTNLPVKPTGGM